LTKTIFGIIALTFISASAASAAERVTDTVTVHTVESDTIIPVPGIYGAGVLVIPADLKRLAIDAYEAVRNTIVEDISDTGTAYAAQPKARPTSQVRELGFEMTPEVETFLRYFTVGRGRNTAIRGVFRSEQYRDAAARIFKEEGVPSDLIWLAQIESVWQPTAISGAGAAGIWQFIPATGQRFGMSCSRDELDERMDFEKSTRGAAKYLSWLSKRYHGNWPLAIGAYNCGEGAMDRAIARNGGVEDFWSISRAGYLPTETANYVPAVLAATLFGTDPTRYDLDGRYAIDASLASAR